MCKLGLQAHYNKGGEEFEKDNKKPIANSLRDYGKK